MDTFAEVQCAGYAPSSCAVPQRSSKLEHIALSSTRTSAELMHACHQVTPLLIATTALALDAHLPGLQYCPRNQRVTPSSRQTYFLSQPMPIVGHIFHILCIRTHCGGRH